MLADVLRAFAGRGGGDLKTMTTLVSDLPDGVSVTLATPASSSAKWPIELKASVATNPLPKATGPVLDPKLLFFGPDR